jgi:glutamine amidotransferase
MVRISLADYGVGNLHSIHKAMESRGAEVTVVEDMHELLDAECIVLPGVGAFTKTMERLLPYREELVQKLLDGTPCLGICIGAQILYEGSDEGDSPGLGLISGRVVDLEADVVPHMGWNWVESTDPLLEGIDSRYFYFAHSYHGQPDEDVVVATTEYGSTFPSMVRKANTYGSQFHPEKSSASGMRLLANFIEFAEGCL